MPRESLTPAQRRLLWVKKERLPLYLQEYLNNKKKKKVGKQVNESDEEEQIKKPTPQPSGEAAKDGEKEDKVTILNLKNDFAIDYTQSENVHNKLREIQEQRRIFWIQRQK